MLLRRADPVNEMRIGKKKSNFFIYIFIHNILSTLKDKYCNTHPKVLVLEKELCWYTKRLDLDSFTKIKTYK